MVKNCIKLFTSAVVTTNNVASIIIPISGSLVLIEWAAVGVITGAVGGFQHYQLSSTSVGQFAANDARDIIDEFMVGGNVAAGLPTVHNKVTNVPAIKVSAGDKIYLHLSVGVAFASANVNVNMQFV